jgi:hypothetical protein
VQRSTRILLDVGVALGVTYVIALLFIALGRFTHPFELEWMEGGMITHAARLLEGQPIYAAPSADFVPFFYTPGYPAVVAGLAKLFGGLSFGLARGVSVVSTAVTLGLLFRIGQREASWRYGALAMGIYAALFRTNGAFYDLARPDALFMAILCSAVYVAYYHRSYRGALLAGALFSVGFFTKQTVSVFVPATGLYLLWRNWRHALVFGFTAVALTVLGVVLLDRAHDGWFWTFIFEGHQGHLFYWKNILLEYWRDVLFVAPALLLLPLLWFGYRVPVRILSVLLAGHWTYAFIFRARTLDYVPHMYYRELWYEDPRWLILIPPALIAALLVAYRAKNGGRIRPRTDPFWLLMYVAGVGASGLNHSTQWAYANCFMLASAFGAILIALAMRDLVEAAEDGPAPRWAALVPAALIVQFAAWVYVPGAQMPGASDDAALAQLDARLAAVEGKVFMPAHPLYSYLRDGEVHTHQMGIQDVAFMKGGVRDLPKRLKAKEWAAVVVDERNRVPGIERHYYLAERFHWPDRDALRAKTGFLVRPETLWLAQSTLPRLLADGLSANFEQPSWLGWSATGGAWANGPSRQRVRGQQGRSTARSNRAGKGVLRSVPVTVQKPRLTALLGGRLKAGELRVRLGDAVVARIKPRRDGRLDRRALNLSAHVGAAVIIELVDNDPKGQLVIDDLRWAD